MTDSCKSSVDRPEGLIEPPALVMAIEEGSGDAGSSCPFEDARDMQHDYAEGALSLLLDPPQATLTLNRPQRRNALNEAIWRALPDVLSEVAAGPAKVLVLRGAGAHFAAGADISEFDRVFADRATAGAYAAQMARGMEALARLDRPTIAMIAGSCVGAGLGLALACDVQIAAADAIFAITPAKLGILYSLADTKRLVDLVGPSVARDMLYTGRALTAVEAQAVGLINEVTDASQLDAAVAAKAQLIAQNSQWSVRHAKAVVAMILDGVCEETETTRRWFVDAIEGADYREGIAAFLAKRPPRFR